VAGDGIGVCGGSEHSPDRYDRQPFEAKVASRFGILPNFFRSARAAPELIERLWSFAEAAYLDNPMPSLLKERLFVFLSRFCPVRYCIVRHVGFLLGHEHGYPAGDISSGLNTVDEVVRLLRRPTPWNRDMESVYQRLAVLTEPMSNWPEPDTELEDQIFACAAILFNEPARSEPARRALLTVIGERKLEFLAGFLAFIRTAHYWTMLHPEIEIEEDMTTLMREHEELALSLREDQEGSRCEMGNRLFDELTALRELHERRELEKAKQALEEKDRQKNQFIAILAHELRNPLAAIRAETDVLTLTGTSDSRAESFRVLVDRQCTAMARMLEDLLDVSRVAFQKVAVTIVDLDFSETIRSVVAECKAVTHAAGLEVTVQLPETPCNVRADAVRLRQVIDNLVSNAIKFTPAPGQITIQLNADPDTAVLRVTDTGMGFDSAIADRLFEPFFQARNDLARHGGGLGLGLAISARLAELQGGKLRAASAGLGKGATFSLTIPRAAQVCDRVRAETPLATGSGQVLLVEDNAFVANSLAKLITLLGFTVKIAADGHEALAHARTMTPHIILCDLGLPNGMDGYAFARAFQSEQRQRPVRLIATSGYSRPEDYANARTAGFAEVLTKPITLDSLRALLFSAADAGDQKSIAAS
jgi:signal transduction histidine kinase/ActR/RegA family two-component response regulator